MQNRLNSDSKMFLQFSFFFISLRALRFVAYIDYFTARIASWMHVSNETILPGGGRDASWWGEGGLERPWSATLSSGKKGRGD